MQLAPPSKPIEPNADKIQIRNKRLAKLAGASSTSNSSQQNPHGETSSSSASAPSPPDPPEMSSKSADQAEPDRQTVPSLPPNPFSSLGLPPEKKPGPNIKIRSASGTSTPMSTSSDYPARSRSRQGKDDSIEAWEDRTLSGIFRFTLHEAQTKDVHGGRLYYLPGVRSDLEEAGATLMLSVSNLDQAILEAATTDGKPLQYLLSCWKRVMRVFRGFRGVGPNDPKFNVVSEAKRLCMSYCIFAATMPEMFGLEPPEKNPLAEHLLVDPDHDHGLCHDFLREAVSRFPEDDSIKEALVGAVEDLSRDLSKMSMNDNFKPYILVS